MCELLAMSANVPTDICFSFSGLMQRGGNTGPHKDGWGITFYEGKGCRSFKDALPSAESKIAKLIKDYPIKSCAVICHIRQANSGSICLENTHPFTRVLWGKNITYAHNGQLSDFKEKLPLKYHQPVGETDSEHAFCYLLDQLYQQFDDQPSATNKWFSYLAEQVHKIAQLGVFNCILSDGRFVFAYCANNLHWITRKAPFGKASLIDAEMTVDFQQETTAEDIVSVIATRPLTDNETWHIMQAGQWLVFDNGLITDMAGQF